MVERIANKISLHRRDIHLVLGRVPERKIYYNCEKCGNHTFAFEITERFQKKLCPQCFGRGKDKRPKELNDLTGADWAKFSLSVQEYPDTRSEKQRFHGACFPTALAKQFIQKYTKMGETVFDPYAGVGTTFDACISLSRNCYGIELSKTFCRVTRRDFPKRTQCQYKLYNGDSEDLDRWIEHDSIDFTITSPPYVSLLKNVRPAFAFKWKEHSQLSSIKNPRPYSDKSEDMGNMSYDLYFNKLERIMVKLYDIMRAGKYMAWVVKDFRDLKAGIPYVDFHGDIIDTATRARFKLWDIVIYNQTKFRPLVCLGYPSTRYYHNIGHSYILVFRKVDDLCSNLSK